MVTRWSRGQSQHEARQTALAVLQTVRVQEHLQRQREGDGVCSCVCVCVCECECVREREREGV